MAGKPLSELRRTAAQGRVKTIPAEKVEVVEAPVETARELEQERGLNEILSEAKIRAAKGEENEDVLAMVKSLKEMLRGG